MELLMLLHVTKYIGIHMILFPSSHSEMNFATSDNCGGQMLNENQSLQFKWAKLTVFLKQPLSDS